MTTLRNTVKAEFLIKSENAYIYKSVTPFDYKYDKVNYTVGGTNGDEFGRFQNLENALKVYNENK
jgi:hypothetical protein